MYLRFPKYKHECPDFKYSTIVADAGYESEGSAGEFHC